jgi:acyl carrier protein
VTTTTTEVHDIVRARGAAPESLHDDAALGAAGLGLDSIAIAEVLFDCEARFGVSFADLLDGKPITVGALIERASSVR